MRPAIRTRALVLVAGLVGCLAQGCPPRPDPAAFVVRTRVLLGLPCTVTVAPDPRDPDSAGAAADAALAEIARWEGVLSVAREDSEISAASRALASGGTVWVSQGLAEFLEFALTAARATEGACDPTAGALRALWDAAAGRDRPPTDGELAAALDRVGFGRLRLEDRALSGPGLVLDPGGLAGGWAVDRAVDVLRERGVQAAMVGCGEGGYALGAPPGAEAWTVPVRDPASPDAPLGVLRLRDQAVAATGGRGSARAVDPRTGRAVEAATWAVAVAHRAAAAHAFAVALVVLGPGPGLEVLGRRGAEGLLMGPEGAASTPGWPQMFDPARGAAGTGAGQ